MLLSLHAKLHTRVHIDRQRSKEADRADFSHDAPSGRETQREREERERTEIGTPTQSGSDNKLTPRGSYS